MKDVKSMTEMATTTVEHKGMSKHEWGANRRNETEISAKSERKSEKTTNVGKMNMKTKYENWIEYENAPELKRSNHQINVPSSDVCVCCVLLATCYIPIVV